MHFRTGFALLAAFVLIITGCRKESEIAAELETGRASAISAYRILSLLHLGEEYAVYRNYSFYSSLAMFQQKDTSILDGDPRETIIDLGKGVVCADGILRKGKYTISFLDTGHRDYYFTLRFNPADSFAISTKKGWEFISGEYIYASTSITSIRLNFQLEIVNENGDLLQKISALQDTLSGEINQPVGAWRSGIQLSGSWNCHLGKTKVHISEGGLLNQGACYSNWNRGELSATDVSGKSWFIHFNPYGNEACDQVFKVSSSKGIFADEMTFDAW